MAPTDNKDEKNNTERYLNLAHRESGNENSPNSYNFASKNPIIPSTNSSSNKSLSPDELNKAENEPRLYSGSGGKDSANLPNKPNIIQGVKKRRKGLAVGGGVAAILTAGVLSLLVMVPYMIVQIEKVLVGYEAKFITKMGNEADQHLLKHAICAQLPGNCKDPADKPATPEEEAAAEAEGEQLTVDMEKLNVTSKPIEQALSNDGVNEVVSNGELSGLESPEGNQISPDSIESDPSLTNTLSSDVESLSEIQQFEPTLAFQTGAPFGGIPEDTAPSDVENVYSDSITNGASAQELESFSEGEQVDQGKAATLSKSTLAADKAAAEATAGPSGPLAEAESETQKLIDSGEAPAVAEETAAKSIFGSSIKPVLITSFLSYACDIKTAADKYSGTRVPTIQNLDVRHASMLLSIADQTKAGKLPTNDQNKVAGLFTGNTSASAANTQAAKPFTQSSQYQAAIGGTGGYALPASSLPTTNAGTQIVNEINQFTPGSGLLCSALNSPFSFLVVGFLGIAQLTADDATLGAGQIALMAAAGAGSYFVTHTLVPEIINYFTPFNLSGKESSTQLTNNTFVGGGILFGDAARSQGAMPLSYSSADSLTAAANKTIALEQSKLPLSTRLFALSDSYSLVSHIVDNMPIGLSSAANTLENYFTNFPSIIIHSFSSIFTEKLFAQSPSNPGQSADFTNYGLTSSQTGQYDPIANENYLFNNKVNYLGMKLQRISALGNPNNYTPTPAGDPNTADLLHCFVDSYKTIEEAPDYQNLITSVASGVSDSTTPDQYNINFSDADAACGSLGSYDYSATYGSNNSQTSNVPNDQTITAIYCNSLAIQANETPLSGNYQGWLNSCDSQVAPQLDNDIGRYSQYLLDLSQMKSLYNLTTNQ